MEVKIPIISILDEEISNDDDVIEVRNETNDLDNIIKTYEIPIKTNKILKIINKFRSLYYQLKFKKHFIKWLWKSRERYFAEKYHPKYLLENLDENTDLDEFLNNW